MADTATMQKVTFSLPKPLIGELRRMVAEGLFPSQNAVVRRALENEVKHAREERIRRQFEEAARDPMFLRDLEETQEAFRYADSETARMIPNG